MIENKMRTFLLSALLGIFLLSSAAMAKDDENGLAVLRRTSKAFSDVAKKTMPAVVSIQVLQTVSGRGQRRNRHPLEEFFGPLDTPQTPKHQQRGLGSGFIISNDGYILTNNHVVGNADEIKVKLNDGREFDAELIGTDPKSDVAVIKIDGNDFPFIELGDSDDLDIGEWAIAIGNPLGLEATLTVGVISAKGRNDLNITRGGYENFIQTDAAINMGNSGGPLLNLDGKAIGINTAIFSQSGGSIGIGFAIPVNIAKNIKDQLLSSGKVVRGYLGIYMNPQEITPELAELFGLKETHGVIITAVAEDSPARNAGMKENDVIIELNGQKIKNFLTFRNSIALLAPGTKVELMIFRDNENKTIKVTVGKMPGQEILAGVSKVAGKEFGLDVEELTKELADEYGYRMGKGVVIKRVAPNSPAAEVGLKRGLLVMSVGKAYVNSTEEFSKAYENRQNKEKLYMLVNRESYTFWAVLSK
jgi:serine protease Do